MKGNKNIAIVLITAAALGACSHVEETDAVPADAPVFTEETFLTGSGTSETETDIPENGALEAVISQNKEQASEKSGESRGYYLGEDFIEPPLEELYKDSGTVREIILTYYEITLSAGDSSMPIVTMYPEDAPDKSEIWTSSDESIACVDGIGNITAISAGSCVIKVCSAASPEVSAEVRVTVEASPEAYETKAAESPHSGGLTYIDGILIANKTYALPADYDPGVNGEALAAFEKMQADAYGEGLDIYISSGFRSYEYQAELYERYTEKSGKKQADRYSARPGHSEHQTGLAFDLNSIDLSFADTDEYFWIKDNCADYGFIIRYPEDGEESTGYMYEPWHIRYLGKETAKKVFDSGLTLEEYLGISSKYAEE